jgi:hypothetical protein
MPSKSRPSKSHSLLTETVACGGGTSGRRERDAVLHDARAYAEHPPQRKEVRNVGWSSGRRSWQRNRRAEQHPGLKRRTRRVLAGSGIAQEWWRGKWWS